MRTKTPVICPNCFEEIDIRVDTEAGSRSWVEECGICDEPMRLKLRVLDDDEVRLRAEVVEDDDDDALDDDEDGDGGELERIDVSCPACWETVELTIDLSAGSQTYTEDCTVCCRPMTVRVTVGDEDGDFDVEVEAESD